MLLQIGSQVNVPTPNPIQGALENLRSLLAPGPVNFSSILGQCHLQTVFIEVSVQYGD